MHFNCGTEDDYRLIPTSRVDDGELYSSAAQQCLLGCGYLCIAHVIERYGLPVELLHDLIEYEYLIELTVVLIWSRCL